MGAQGLGGEELEDVAGPGDFADAFRQGLAFFTRQKRPKLGLARQYLGAGGVEHVEALLRRRILPGFEGGAGGGDGRLDLGFAGRRIDADNIVGIRRVKIVEGLVDGDPFAVDQVAVDGAGPRRLVARLPVACQAVLPLRPQQRDASSVSRRLLDNNLNGSE